MKDRCADEQIIGISKEAEANMKVAGRAASTALAMRRTTTTGRKSKFGGLTVSAAQGAGSENGELKRWLAEAMLDNAALKFVGLLAFPGRCIASARYNQTIRR